MEWRLSSDGGIVTFLIFCTIFYTLQWEKKIIHYSYFAARVSVFQNEIFTGGWEEMEVRKVSTTHFFLQCRLPQGQPSQPPFSFILIEVGLAPVFAREPRGSSPEIARSYFCLFLFIFFLLLRHGSLALQVNGNKAGVNRVTHSFVSLLPHC